MRESLNFAEGCHLYIAATQAAAPPLRGYGGLLFCGYGPDARVSLATARLHRADERTKKRPRAAARYREI